MARPSVTFGTQQVLAYSQCNGGVIECGVWLLVRIGVIYITARMGPMRI
jgi:hypothetical protein